MSARRVGVSGRQAGRASHALEAALRRTRAERGFTLVELTAALVAGLIVALGIVGLAREATRTFHEEVRSSAAEATLRTAIDRLRADFSRASYMGTGNIVADPSIARAPTSTNTAGIGTSMIGLLRLSGVRLVEGGSPAAALSLSTVQSIAPDLVEIGGNLTSSEQFEVQAVDTPSGNCQRIRLAMSSAAMYRIVAAGGAQPGTELRNVFQPVLSTSSTQFIVRLVDETGRSQYLATCARSDAAGIDTTTGIAYVWIDAINTPIRTAQSTQTVGGQSGGASGRSMINPVQIVRWEITSAAAASDPEPARYVNGLDNQSLATGADPNKYDLMRTYVDALGNLVPETSEIVAEYAVDLDIAFTVDTSLDSTGASAHLVTYAFDDPTNGTWAYDVSKTPPSMTGPQRIRAIRARLATRTAQADRSVTVPVTNYGTQSFLYRYCVNTLPSCTTYDGTLRWARVRTMTTQVSIPNQSRNFF